MARGKTHIYRDYGIYKLPSGNIYASLVPQSDVRKLGTVRHYRSSLAVKKFKKK